MDGKVRQYSIFLRWIFASRVFGSLFVGLWSLYHWHLVLLDLGARVMGVWVLSYHYAWQPPSRGVSRSPSWSAFLQQKLWHILWSRIMSLGFGYEVLSFEVFAPWKPGVLGYQGRGVFILEYVGTRSSVERSRGRAKNFGFFDLLLSGLLDHGVPKS